MKKVKLFLGVSFLSISVFSQGWVGNTSNNSLYPVNSSLGLSPLSIGIGTNAPTQQLHTTGGVRFQGVTQDNTISRVMGADANGNLFWRDASTMITPPNNNFWSLIGNAATNPGVGSGQNYFGTSDAKRIVFATSAAERMTILPTGQVGIGNTNPNTGLLTVGSGTFGLGIWTSQLYTFQLLGKGVNTVEHLGMFNNDQSTSRSELTVSNSGTGKWEDNFVAIMVHGPAFSYQNRNDYYLNENNAGLALINAQSNANASVPLKKFSIGVASSNIPLSFYTNNVERIFITPQGQTGIATKTPTAALHVNCSPAVPLVGASNIRFENLQQGSGNYLVIDNNGYVRRSTLASASATMQATSSGSLQSEIEELKKIITDLQNKVNMLLTSGMQVNGSTGGISNNTLDISPTPFGNNVKIVYSIQDFKSNTILQIIDANGSLLKTLPLYQPKGQLDVQDLKVSNGVLFFNIIADGKNIISKKSIKI